MGFDALEPLMQSDAVPQDELDAFVASGRDARYYGITTYQDPAGARFEFANRVHRDRGAQMDFVSPRRSRVPVTRARTATFVEFNFLLDSSARQNSKRPAHRPGAEGSAAAGRPSIHTDRAAGASTVTAARWNGAAYCRAIAPRDITRPVVIAPQAAAVVPRFQYSPPMIAEPAPPRKMEPIVAMNMRIS